MAIGFNVSNRPASEVRADLLAVPVFADRVLGPGADAVDAALEGGITTFMTESGFEGKPGETLAVPTAGRLGAKVALLVGLGKADDVTLDGLRRAGAAVARRASKVANVATTLVDAAPAGSTARRRRRRWPRASCSARTSTSPTSPTPSRRSCDGSPSRVVPT